jgi:hypothetical protein
MRPDGLKLESREGAKNTLQGCAPAPHSNVPGSLNQVNIGFRSSDWSCGFESVPADEAHPATSFGLE